MTNNDNWSYLGDVFIGSNDQNNQVVWDTGSFIMNVRTTDCSSCPSTDPMFDISASTSFAYVTPYGDYPRGTTYVDGTSVSGHLATDKTCPINTDPAACMSSFRWNAVDEASGLRSTESGVLGMMAREAYYDMNLDELYVY